MDTNILLIMYLIIGADCVAVGFDQYTGNSTVNVPVIIIHALIWPLLLIMDIRFLVRSKNRRCEGKGRGR
jgi:hypothetical protein